MKLLYRATSRDGKIVQGLVDAKDIKEAVAYLRSKGLLPIRISEQKEKGVHQYIPFFNRSEKELVFFTEQLSSMLVSGLTLLQALNILRDQIKNTSMRNVIQNVISDIEEGRSLSLAIEKYPDVFPAMYVSSVKAGEQSGLLDKVLLRLAENLEKKQKLKGTIKSALMYPIIVMIGMVIIVILMIVLVVPKLVEFSQSLNIPLPATLQILVLVSNSAWFWPLCIIVCFISYFLFRRWYGSESGRLIIDAWVLKIPVFGKLISETILTEFTRTLGLLIGSGTLVVDALKQTSDSADNVLYKNAIVGVSNRVEKGISVGDSMLSYALFPPILVQMVKIGEQTGKLDESLVKVSEYFERELDDKVRNLTTALEPFILIALGVGVAFLIYFILTPIYSVMTKF